MKGIKNISVLLLAVVFLLSATGVVVFQSYCMCTGNGFVSVYVAPETCEKNYHTHHIHLQGREEIPSSENECHECTSHTNECGCNNVIISFIKLKNEVVFEKVRSKISVSVAAVVPDRPVNLFFAANDDAEGMENGYIDPPSTRTSLDFLIPLNQLKIPCTA